MKKKVQNFDKELKMPHLLRDDLENIEAIIKELSPSDCKIETEEYEYSSIQEIPSDLKAVNEFNLRIYSPYLSLNLYKSGAFISSDSGDFKLMGAVKKIMDIISKRERKYLWYFSSLSSWMAPILFVIPFYLIVYLDEEIIKSNKGLFLSTFFVSLLAIIWWISGFIFSLKRFSLIEFVYRKNKSNFFIRNKDQIIVNILVVVFTVLLTLFVQKIFK